MFLFGRFCQENTLANVAGKETGHSVNMQLKLEASLELPFSLVHSNPKNQCLEYIFFRINLGFKSMLLEIPMIVIVGHGA